MNEMILLGAGASQEAGIPLAYEMSKRMLQRFERNSHYSVNYDILAFVIGGLLFQQGRKGNNPYDGVNIEEVFNAVQLLAERNDLEVAPFVGSWHEMVERFDRVSESRPQLGVRRIAKDFARSLQSGSDRFNDLGDLTRVFEDFGRDILEAVKRQEGRPGEGHIFRETNERMIDALRNFVWIKDAKLVSYLCPLIKLLRQQHRLVIATLNYDNAVELLSDAEGIECSTGIEQFSKGNQFELGSTGLYLIKLHGSIDWAHDYSDPPVQVPRRILGRNDAQTTQNHAIPGYRIRKVAPDQIDKERYRPAVIFGQRNKLTTEGPFLDLLRVFREELFSTDRITIVGYSFRDPHINEYLWQWLTKSEANRMRILDSYLSGVPVHPSQQGVDRFGQLLGQDFIDRLLTWCEHRVNITLSPASHGLRQMFPEHTESAHSA